MVQAASFVSTGEAAGRLGVSVGTVLNMLDDGRLFGLRGNQPRRPRWRIGIDENGYLIDKTGAVVPGQQSRSTSLSKLEELRDRVAALERQSPAPRPDADERFREAALMLNEVADRQRRALDLQAQATQLLNEALTEQGRILAGLLVPDPSEFTVESSQSG